LWIPVPLATRHARVNALFASIITTTPGTVSCVVDEEQGVIWVHALNGDDPQAMADDMKQRYEAPLLKALGVSADANKESA
jgi:multicomponent K+:H+ antiporter subunit E